MHSVLQNHYHVLLLISQGCHISLESSNIQSLFLWYGKGPYYDKISVRNIKNEFSDSKKTLQSLQLNKSRIPSLSSEQSSEMPGHSSVSNINNDALNQRFS